MGSLWMMTSNETLVVTASEERSNHLVVAGEIDAHTSEVLADAVALLGSDADISLDLAGVTFIDSSGLRLIVMTHSRQRSDGGSLTIASPSTSVRRLLEITGLDGELTIS